jgi:hypothetical protein
MFDNLITPQFKQIFDNAINTILAEGSLSVPCRLIFDKMNSPVMCNNCQFDPISRLSANIYNGSGPLPFSDGQTCPVCMGDGYNNSGDVSEILHLGVIFDSKYWLNIPQNGIEIANGSIQTICSSSYLNKLRNAKYLEIVESHGVGSKSYDRAGDPNLCGFGNTNYCITMWTSK